MHTAPLDLRLATVADTALLIGLMRDFYAEDKLDFDDTRVRRALASLLEDPRNGEVLLWLDEAGSVVGYGALAMADPDSVPAGKYGREALTRPRPRSPATT